jgi:hypothetical protein
LTSHRSADTNTGLTFGTKGTGVFSFNTNADGTPVTQLQVLHTSSAVNFLKLSGNSAGNTPIIKADGTDSNIGIAIQGKGSGTHSFYTDIGGAAPIQFQVLHTAAATRNITITGSNGGNPTISATGGLVAFGVGISINGSAIFGNGIGISNTTPQNGGIAFPATQVAIADANTLDDYEEGTWTPSLGGNTTYTTQSGTYTKIGNLVFINASIVVNTIGTGSTSQVSGFPFTANGTNAFPLNIRVVTSSATAIVSAYAVLGASSTTAIVISRTAASTADAVNAIFGNNTQVQINGCYQV